MPAQEAPSSATKPLPALEEDRSLRDEPPSRQVVAKKKEKKEKKEKRRRCSRRRCCCRVFSFLIVCCASAGLYLFFLLMRSGIMLEPQEVSIAFEDGGIQANISVQSQFLPGRSSEEFALDFGRLQCGISSRIEDQRSGFVQRDGIPRQLFSIHFGGDGKGHRISNGLTRTDNWQIVLDSGECVSLSLCLSHHFLESFVYACTFEA